MQNNVIHLYVQMMRKINPTNHSVIDVEHLTWFFDQEDSRRFDILEEERKIWTHSWPFVVATDTKKYFYFFPTSAVTRMVYDLVVYGRSSVIECNTQFYKQ